MAGVRQVQSCGDLRKGREERVRPRAHVDLLVEEREKEKGKSETSPKPR